MSEYTAGKWLIRHKPEDPNCIVILSEDDRAIATAWNLLGPKDEPANTPVNANARLIAAAPELLAACEAVMEFLSNGTPVNPGALVQAEVFNAIRKAKGGAA